MLRDFGSGPARLILMLFFLALIGPANVGFSQTAGSDASDRQAIERAILDYVEAFYEADPSKGARSIRQDLAKQGFYWKPDAEEYELLYMSYDQFMNLSATLFKNDPPPPDAPKEITIYDIQDKTASAKVVALWGSDYIHLGKFDGKWMIVNVLWQSLPHK